MLKSKKIVDWLYNYSLYFIIGALLLVIIAIEPSFVRVSNFTTILTQSASSSPTPSRWKTTRRQLTFLSTRRTAPSRSLSIRNSC